MVIYKTARSSQHLKIIITKYFNMSTLKYKIYITIRKKRQNILKYKILKHKLP